jgi:hypothetical protein
VGTSVATARRHLREALEAKNARTRQGPAWPAPNAFTGRRDAQANVIPGEGDAEVPPAAGPPPPEAVPTIEDMRGRGNQAMRRQK